LLFYGEQDARQKRKAGLTTIAFMNTCRPKDAAAEETMAVSEKI
jgi:hypothetical protein